MVDRPYEGVEVVLRPEGGYQRERGAAVDPLAFKSEEKRDSVGVERDQTERFGVVISEDRDLLCYATFLYYRTWVVSIASPLGVCWMTGVMDTSPA